MAEITECIDVCQELVDVRLSGGEQFFSEEGDEVSVDFWGLFITESSKGLSGIISYRASFVDTGPVDQASNCKSNGGDHVAVVLLSDVLQQVN